MAYQKLARRLKFLIASYQRHGLRHVAEVFRQERQRRAYARAPLPLPERDALMRSFRWFAGKENFLADFHRSASLRLPLTLANRKEFFTNLLLSFQPYDEILSDAELPSEGKFPALGICIAEPDGDFDWHRDYSSGKRWPRVPYNAVQFMQNDGADVKYVWELSRMYWIAWLGKAYWVSGNRAWAADFTRLIDSWSRANPANTGVNWSMPMEIAIRGYWLAMGYALFQGAPNIPDEWWIDYLRLAWGHAAHLERNLEYFSNLTNHYLSNCFGLVALGTLFAGSAEGDRWLADGRRRMIEEIGHQVLPDGVHYERSIGYHRLVLEMYLIAMPLLERAGVPFPEESRAAIERMAEFARDYIPPAGTVPQLGDSDDGVIMRVRADQELYDHRDTMAMAAALFRRPDFLAASGGYSQAALLALGSEGFEGIRDLAPAAPPLSQLYRDGGFAILRTHTLHLLADVGEIGLHGNNDTLSFTLSGPAGAIIIDPGTYCYTRDPAVRDRLRSTGAHNTPALDGTEIAEFDGLWRIKRDLTDVKILRWEPGADPAMPSILEARHSAYRALAAGAMTVRRRWELAGDTLALHDSLEGSGNHTASVRFTVPEGLLVRRLDEHTAEIIREGIEKITLASSLPLAIREGWYSPSYGVASPGTWIELEATIDGTMDITYTIRRVDIPE